MASLPFQQHERNRHSSNIWLCLALMLSVLSISTSTETKTASVQDLRTKLFEHYDKLVRPVVDQKTVTNLYVGMTPNAITYLDEEKQIMELDSWVLMRWKDEFLVWNPEEHGGIISFNIPSTEIWRPDLTVYTGSPAKKIVIEVLTNAIINYTGDVLWVPPVNIRIRCPQDGYEKDTKTCLIRMGSWTYHEYRLNVQRHSTDVKLDDFDNSNPNWELVSITTDRRSKFYPCCQEPYPYVDYKVTVRKKSNYRSSRRSASTHERNHVTQHHHCPFMHYHHDNGCD